jgi:hypothetical protein
MFNYRENLEKFKVTVGSFNNTRLFFLILNHPWEALQAIKAFKEEVEQLNRELYSLNEELNKEKATNAKLREAQS